MHAAYGLHHRIDGGVIENVLKSMGDPGIRQLQIPTAQHLGHAHILPARHNVVYALSNGAEAQ